ncbi:YciI family protein [Nocardioides speluncae]|uniref:YciI family protein n=1 Tax=Nocardioides speluncae TaxID=2670337 RepID=UPI000D696940|nr:YciI family protein [Nocardioides speluncae]
MTEYAVLLIGDEGVWERATPEQRTETYGRHDQYMKALEERGHKITGGAELSHSRTARTLRGSSADATVTDGPYAETVEQLGGFYLVETDNLDDLIEVSKILSDGDGGIEIRACVPPPDEDGA